LLDIYSVRSFPFLKKVLEKSTLIQIVFLLLLRRLAAHHFVATRKSPEIVHRVVVLHLPFVVAPVARFITNNAAGPPLPRFRWLFSDSPPSPHPNTALFPRASKTFFLNKIRGWRYQKRGRAHFQGVKK
jgi:hypothetical protein